MENLKQVIESYINGNASQAMEAIAENDNIFREMEDLLKNHEYITSEDLENYDDCSLEYNCSPVDLVQFIATYAKHNMYK